MDFSKLNLVATMGFTVLLFFFGRQLAEVPEDIQVIKSDLKLIQQRIDFEHGK